MLSGEATNTNFIVFGFTRSRLEPPIYSTRGQQANHYTTDALIYKKELEIKKTTEAVSSASFLDIYLNLDTNDQLSTRLYERRYNELDITTRRDHRLRDRMVVEQLFMHQCIPPLKL